MAWYEWRPYVPVAVRRQNATREIARFRKKGQPIAPIVIQGRTIARSFWGKAWCDNLERYSDFANRLPRGRSYVRNGSVMDLQLGPGTVKALVSGSDCTDLRRDRAIVQASLAGGRQGVRGEDRVAGGAPAGGSRARSWRC
jgi:hypothetical protein